MKCTYLTLWPEDAGRAEAGAGVTRGLTVVGGAAVVSSAVAAVSSVAGEGAGKTWKPATMAAAARTSSDADGADMACVVERRTCGMTVSKSRLFI